ncbi:MAG: hypothetical protein JXR16_12050 [Bermanella sp.]
MPILFALLLLFCTSVSAEDTGNLVPRSLAMGVTYTSIDSAQLSDSPYKLSINQTKVKLPIGKYQLFGNTFVPQLSYEETQFSVPNPNIDNRISLYSLNIPLMFISKSNINWTRILRVTPSWHTDLKAKDEESYSLMGLLLWRYHNTDSPHSYTLGFGVNRLFGEYKPIPMISYGYQTSPHTRINVGFPITKIEHRLHQDWSVFSAFGPMGGNWRYDARNTEQRYNLSYQSWVATLGVRRHLAGDFWLTFQWGQSFERKFDVNNNTIDSEEVSIDDASVYLISIGLHP